MKKYLAIFLLMLVVPLTISAQQTITVTGTVTDTQDEPMIGVNITVKDVAGLGTITDINGNFSIKMEPYHRLVFSYIGYDDVEVLVKEQHTVNVKMKESEASVLDEVVVTGMGAQKKLTVTGAVTNVNVGDLKRFPTSNMSTATLRPKRYAVLMICCTRSTLDANVAMMMREFVCSAKSASIVFPTVRSDWVKPLRSALVLSHMSARTPFLPSSPKRCKSIASP